MTTLDEVTVVARYADREKMEGHVWFGVLMVLIGAGVLATNVLASPLTWFNVVGCVVGMCVTAWFAALVYDAGRKLADHRDLVLILSRHHLDWGGRNVPLHTIRHAELGREGPLLTLVLENAERLTVDAHYTANREAIRQLVDDLGLRVEALRHAEDRVEDRERLATLTTRMGDTA